MHDILDRPVPGQFGAIYSLDVLEHLAPNREQEFIQSMVLSLTATGATMVGVPLLEWQAHASPPNRAGHVNCKSGHMLKALFQP